MYISQSFIPIYLMILKMQEEKKGFISLEEFNFTIYVWPLGYAFSTPTVS